MKDDEARAKRIAAKLAQEDYIAALEDLYDAVRMGRGLSAVAAAADAVSAAKLAKARGGV